MNVNLTSYDKAIIAAGGLVVSICAARGVDASGPVQAVVGLLLILLPVAVYYKANHGLSYKVASKAIASLPAVVAGVVLLFGIDVGPQLEQVGVSILALLPFLVAAVGNSASVKT